MTRDVLVSVLKGWTGKSRAIIIYDSTVDEFTDQGLFDKVKGKANIALVGFTADGDVFGGFYNIAVTKQDDRFRDPNMFVFSFESHGRCKTPQRFVVKEELRNKKYVRFCKDDSHGFVCVGGWYGHFYLGNEKSHTYCHNLSSGFMGIENTTLTGKGNNENFTCTRIVAVHLQKVTAPCLFPR